MVCLHLILWGSILRAFLSTEQRELLPQSGIDRKTPHPILRIPPVIAHQLASARGKWRVEAHPRTQTGPRTLGKRMGAELSALLVSRCSETPSGLRGAV